MTESVWDYPRPPRVEPSDEHVVVTHHGVVLADTTASLRVLETSHPPTYYLPRSAFAEGVLRAGQKGASWCEWMGGADYYDLVVGEEVLTAVAWTYPTPAAGFAALTDHLALYPGRVERCTVDGEVVEPQPGSFYGGWITARVTGPFKGSPGTSGW
jgi:uncharacterized protein (DUF427 family)